MLWLKWFWNTKLLRRVSYHPDGKPFDCHGLQYKNGKPFEEGCEYLISSEWRGWDYLGKGVYMKPAGIQCDIKNPYYAHMLSDQLVKFKERFNAPTNTK